MLKRLLLSLCPGLACLWVPCALAADPESPRALLRLSDGGYLPGVLTDSPRPSVIRWQGAAFRAPFDFAIDAVEGVHWTSAHPPAQPRGDFYIELLGGDALFGSIVALDGQQVVVDATGFGNAHVERSNIKRMDRISPDSGWIYLGPDGLNGWRELGTTGGWKEQGGRVVSDRPGSTIVANLGLPARAMIELELSWFNEPDFVLAFGVGDEGKSHESAFRFEVWNENLVVLRENEKYADVDFVTKLERNHGRILLRAYIDQPAGRMLVYSSQGKPLAELNVAGTSGPALPGVSFTNLGDIVRLEQLRIGRWNGQAPSGATFRQAPLVLADGDVVTGQVIGFEASTREFLVRDGSGDRRIGQDRVASVFFPEAEVKPPGDRQIVVLAGDGSRLSGDWLKVEDGEVWLKVPGVVEPAHLPIASLRSLLSLKHKAVKPGAASRVGTLVLEDTELIGSLAASPDPKEPAGYAWQPTGSATASALRPGVSGRINFQARRVKGRAGGGMPGAPDRVPMQALRPAANFGAPAPAPPVPARPIRAVVQDGAGIVVFQPNGAVLQRNAAGEVSEAHLAFAPFVRPTLHLRVGDSLPAVITRIDEAGVHFQSPVAQTTFAPHSKIKAAELAPESFIAVSLTRSKRERLLMLPRLQRESPPTQLLYSVHGDFLRGRVLEMDDSTLKFEVQLEERIIPRDRVARIIWFHADELDASKPAAGMPDPDTPNLVQAVCKDSIRVTFVVERVANDSLLGKSDVLGPCRVDLVEVNELLIGSAIPDAAGQLPYEKWKLHDAPDPRFAQEDAGGAGGSSTGKESPLVGKPAPDFELDLLSGPRFRLSDARGKVVVLDFWATWCGPCVQAMPQVEAAASAFRDQNVQLIAVNLQEKPDQISAMLKRLKLEVNVALDREGTVAEQYGAHAIPQTVIIDRQGQVARLFIGGGPHLGDQLREALKAVLNPEEAQAPQNE